MGHGFTKDRGSRLLGGSIAARGCEAGSIEGVAGEVDSFRLVAFVKDHVASHPSLEVLPRVAVLPNHDFGWHLTAKVALEFFRG